MGFQQGLSGLNSSSKSLDTIGNNIANSGTVGFKSGSAQFADVFAASLNGAGSAPVGIGTKVAAVVQQFSQGNITVTNNPLDTAINGGGFFQMDDGSGGTFYARNGQFQLDKNGFIVSPQGSQLKGIPAVNGVIATGAPAQALRLFDPTQSLSGTPQATGSSASSTGVQANVNLDSRLGVPATAVFSSTDPTSYNQSTATTIYDSLGNPHTYSMYFVKSAAANNAWSVYTTVTNPAGATPAFSDLSAPSGAGAAAIAAATTTAGLATAAVTGAAAAAATLGANSAAVLANAAVAASPAPVLAAATAAEVIGTAAEGAAAGGATPAAAAAAVALVAGVPASVVTAANTAAAAGGATVASVLAAVQMASAASVSTAVAAAAPGAVQAAVAGAPVAVLIAAAAAAVAPGATATSVLMAVSAAAQTMTGTLTFNTSGTLTSAPFAVSLTDAQLGYTGAVDTPQAFPLDFSGSTQYGAAFAVNAMVQDGYSSGTLAGFNIGSDGIVLGRYTNGQTKPVGQVVLATFRNPQGLQPLGDNRWAQSSTSGDPIIGSPGSSGQYGALQASALEDSNVDLTAELVNMITQQRAYQANAQTIKTVDSILQTLVSLR
jgi:flagellar hook protein FlgE